MTLPGRDHSVGHPSCLKGRYKISARAARGVRGLHHDTGSPHVADAGIEAHKSGSASRSSSRNWLPAHVPRVDLGAIIYPHVHAPKSILHRLSRSDTDPSCLSCASHRNVLSLDVAKGRRYGWRRCFRFGRSVAAAWGDASVILLALPVTPWLPGGRRCQSPR